MTSRYSRLNPATGLSQEHLTQNQAGFAQAHDVPLENMGGGNYEAWRPFESNPGSLNDNFQKTEMNVETRPLGHRTNTGSSLKPVSSGPWEHKLNEKHLRDVPSQTDTVRYFDPRRQTRRVFLEGVFMWLWTAGICGALAGTMYGFSTLTFGLTQYQKYGYNALITGLSIVLGLAFAAQFKQYAEMMRWRFLASQYRSIGDFEDVLGCDSYRSTLRILWHGRKKGAWYPSKAQLVAAFWLLVFVIFNVCAALLGLTYSIDVSDTSVFLSEGPASVIELHYISSKFEQDRGAGYSPEFQKAAANVYGQVGSTFDLVQTASVTDYLTDPKTVYATYENDLYWNRFIDLSPADMKTNRVTDRTVTSQATCIEYTITFGGYAGFNTDDSDLMFELDWVDDQGRAFTAQVDTVATGSSTWMGNSSSDCGPRCAQLLVLQTADNSSDPDVLSLTPVPRLWACNNTVGQVTFNTDFFEDPSILLMPDAQAKYLAGSIGWTGVSTIGVDLQINMLKGDTIYNPPGNYTAEDIAGLIMRYSSGALAAADQLGGPRINAVGQTPSPAQVVNVKWKNAALILAGIPIVQFIMLLGVVWFASKAIILEPSYMTAAHLLYPVIKKVGKDGCLFTVDEMAERLGPDYKLAYGVRPDVNDPGHHDTTFVRDLDVIEETEGYGYIRGRMPEGRYD